MARKKAFDRNEVLEKAMDVFWQKGYEATSVEDLVQQMGINRGSLYDTFGDKHKLFLAAIAHYEETIVSQAIAQLESPDAGKQAIIAYFKDVIDRLVKDGRRGCLMTNAAVELCPHDSEAVNRISANLDRIEAAFLTALTTAQARGEISAQLDRLALARFLTSTLQGLRVICKVKADRAVLQTIVEIAVSVLDR
jgi:TetR/AcrR family transcriptional regulator, transcriptional repressor for nem operon